MPPLNIEVLLYTGNGYAPAMEAFQAEVFIHNKNQDFQDTAETGVRVVTPFILPANHEGTAACQDSEDIR